MARTVELTPEAVAELLLAQGRHRAWILTDPGGGEPRASLPQLGDVAAHVATSPDYADHEAIFLGVGRETHTLFGVFLHATRRGQAQGGVRYWPYSTLASFLHDGLRLAVGMGRKCALAGLWWGGGKALIARAPHEHWRDPSYRRVLFAEFGQFVTSLRGCYVTAEDAGTNSLDMEEIYRHSRYVTCVPIEFGGSGNPSTMTAAGVLCAMEAAVETLALGSIQRGSHGLQRGSHGVQRGSHGDHSLAGLRIAMQGAGNVGAAMIDGLLERGVASVVASELSSERRADLLERYAGLPVEIRLAPPGDDSILAERCDVLVPNALGGVLNAKTIPGIRARLVCGAANNPLLDEVLDAEALAARGIAYVPDYVANRMGIVSCSNEQYGSLPDDPTVLRHLDPAWPDSIARVTREVLERARDEGTSSAAAAAALADCRSHELHPIWGHRGRAIIDTLVRERWDRG